MRIIAGMMLVGAMTACVVDEGDDALQGGNGKADGNNVCEVPEYGDGTCHIDLACEVPDVDCFVTFDNDAAAAAWLPDIGRGNKLPESDPRFVRARRLLDQAWTLYQKYVPVGTKLAEKRLALIVTDSAVANAFVMPDADGMRGGFVVTVEGGLVAEDQPDTMVIGTLLHEMKHLTGLHWLPDVTEKLERHYVAPEGSEPIGARQQNEARVESHLEGWIGHAIVVGDWTDARLRGVPVSGDMQTLMSAALQHAPCASYAANVNKAYEKLDASLSKLDYSIGMDDAGYIDLASSFAAFETCWSFGTNPSLQQLATTYAIEWTFDFLTEDEKMKLALPAPSAIREIVEGRRKQQRDIEAAFTMELGRPWSAARYFSAEEQADDASIHVLVREGMDARAANKFFLSALGDGAPSCETAIAAKSVPYGVMLSDDHHGTCWRYAHGLQLIETPSTMARETSPIVEDREPRIPRPATRIRPID